MTALGIDIDLREDFLEEHWADECECDFPHADSICSKAVTHRGYCCIVPTGQNVCLNAATRIAQSIETPRSCGHCNRPVADCWRVISV